MPQTEALVTWLSLLTPAELADLAASYDWTADRLDWSARPRIADVLTALDALVVHEQQRRRDPAHDPLPAALAVGQAMSALDKGDLQILIRAYRRLARNRARDASEPVQRYHEAVADLLTEELAGRLRG